VIDLRRQRIFAALDGRASVTLADLCRAADVSSVLAGRELKRLGWKKRGQGYMSPMAQMVEPRKWRAGSRGAAAPVVLDVVSEVFCGD